MSNSKIEIYQSAIKNNLKILEQSGEVTAVIKANAYGLGDIFIHDLLSIEGISRFAVADIKEAIRLRSHDSSSSITIITPLFSDELQDAFENDLTMIICNLDDWNRYLDNISTLAISDQKKLNVILKVNIGMGRYGCKIDEALRLAKNIHNHPAFCFEGIMGHLSYAHEPDTVLSIDQIERFQTFVNLISKEIGYQPSLSLWNTAGNIRFGSSYDKDLTSRVGLGLHGLVPNPDIVSRKRFELSFKWTTRIRQISNYDVGERISYSGKYLVQRPSRMAIIPVGYADGLPLSASEGDYFCLGNYHLPICGTITMNHSIVDVTDCPIAKVGSEVEIVGSYDDIDRWCKRHFHSYYSFMCGLSPAATRTVILDDSNCFLEHDKIPAVLSK
jgi:alanine racemase